ncbi:type VI secretion system-associated FHA domain protein TagH [Aquicoccus sp. G2-2]|uniref:type VI secretion system-associated FHA domain protein TagH n=1 Tax=Aquicoccus sp. G2-2 TaxID=3092120 RepID=UPI002AE07E1E|nr:type VI secretion system-associated FHA domain protein TagH [Aquicoccus sp. G2-2]MEA1114684.1 type VI secretion system-associated FHA domain protein TagH [Aquicoccus sp. G2-2]
MTLRLILESSPQPQQEQERSFVGGTFVIGRGDDVDWQLVDPEMFVSRRHCIISDSSGEITVTDASSGGLYLDNASSPLGTGNTVALGAGMRLRLGDFVVRVEEDVAAQSAPQQSRAKPDGFAFGDAPMPDAPRERPSELPQPFDPRAKSNAGALSFGENGDAAPLKPAEWENPLGLDLRKGGATPQKAPDEPKGDLGGSKYFSGFDASPAPEPAAVSEQPQAPVDPPPAPAPAAPLNTAPPVPAAVPDNRLRAAFFRGAGLDPSRIQSADPEAEMEALGARMRELVDGLMMLLRSRAEEKGRARVAQTIIANEDVNPLKFLATSEDALTALLEPHRKGYLPPDQAVNWAYRDLADHQMRTWRALQAALRRMIDRFDPEEIEKEVADLGLLEKLIAGGKSAKLWDLYQDHYRDLAQSAEEQFLGEVGADFRDAYENRKE